MEPAVIFAPPPNSAALWLMVAAVAMFPVAVVVEFLRRRMAARRRLNMEWAELAQIAARKGIAGDDLALLQELIAQHSPLDPLGPATARHHFDRCVGAYVADLSEANPDLDAIEHIGQQLRDIRKKLGLDFVALGKRITSTRELELGQMLWLAPADQSPPQRSRVRVVHLDEVYFSVRRRAKAGEGPRPRFTPGAAVRCRMWREEDARYVFTVEFVRYEDYSETWTFRHTAELRRIQARADFRVRQDIALAVDVLTTSQNGTTGDPYEQRPSMVVEGRLVNLSAGGCGVILSQTLPKRALLRMQLPIDDESPVTLVARIVATTPLDGRRNLMRCAFVTLPDESRDRLARHVLRCQQAQLSLHPLEAGE